MIVKILKHPFRVLLSLLDACVDFSRFTNDHFDFKKQSHSKDFCRGTSLFVSLFVSLLVSFRSRASTHTWNVLERVLERFLVGNYCQMIHDNQTKITLKKNVSGPDTH